MPCETIFINLASISNSCDPLEEIDFQLKTRLDRKRSNDTTSGGSDVTVIEGNVPEEAVGDKKNYYKIDYHGTDKVETPEVESDKTEDAVNEVFISKPATLPSCLFRRDSSRASIKKKVRCSESAEVIPESHYFINSDDWHEVPHEDDDDVFSDSAPVQTPRGNMCTPYVERKGSLPGLEALPDWFPNSRLISDSIKSIHFVRVMLPWTWFIYLSVGESFVVIAQFFVYSSFILRSNSFSSSSSWTLFAFLLANHGKNLVLVEFSLRFVSAFMLKINV